MNPSDEERKHEQIREVPEEHIERHTNPIDSYREPTVTDDEEEIIQPPLDPPEEEMVEVVKQEDVTSVESVVNEQTTETQTSVSDIIASSPLITQEQILAGAELVIPMSDSVPESLPKQQIPIVNQESELVMSESQISTQPKVIYHTVSGGPETIHDIKSGHTSLHQTDPTVHPAMSSGSGYTIQNQNYVSPEVVTLDEQNNFGIVLFLGIMAIIGGIITYVYFFMPQTFDQLYDAIVIIKDQVLQ